MSSTSALVVTGKKGLVQECLVAKAADLLALLEPPGDRGEETIIYRGQPSSNFGLRPTAYRNKTHMHCGKECSVPESMYWASPAQVELDAEHLSQEERVELEFNLVRHFCGLADQAGIQVPDLERLRTDVAPEPFNFPPPRLRAAFALARHAGVPSRLLDWSFSPLHAAYFAAREVAERFARGEREEGHFSVWELNVTRLDKSVPASFTDEIRLVAAPAAYNPYLRAQMGVFSLVVAPQPRKLPPILPDVDELIRGRPDGPPVLRRVDVPKDQACIVMRLLAQRGVTADRLFPSLEGVALAMLEHRRYREDPDA